MSGSTGIDKSTVHRVVYCAPLIELSWYPFSKYTNFLPDIDLASSLLHKSRCRQKSDRQSPEVSDSANASLWHIYRRPHTHAQTYDMITMRSYIHTQYCTYTLLKMYVERFRKNMRDEWIHFTWCHCREGTTHQHTL
jgi:hypothetical protein